ncbi:MAG TPA: hypothetical protein VG370_19725 [Chloroflexota bacterium]|nr:hypothetical protein [Chloroflexota bacterium]
MTTFKRGALFLLLAALLLPQSIASGQAPGAAPSARTDTLVLGGALPRPAEPDELAAAAAAPLSTASGGVRSALEVSSVSFVQVYSPFMWGRTSLGGLSVDLTLGDAARNTKGVSTQSLQAAPNNYVKVDRTQLYFETVFVDPNTRSPVWIMPGDQVHVVTSGQDTDGQPRIDDRWIVVDDVRAWTSYERDVVEGTAPAGSSIVVTKTSSLSLSSYLTPGSSVTYAETTAGPDGRFQVAAFRTSTNATPAKADLDKGVTGFVRVRHPDGNEVYTVHGQNPFVLESSPVVHGFAFKPPSAPGGLEANVAVSRPAPTVSVVHKGPAGNTKGNVAATLGTSTFDALLPSTIGGGDTIEVAINGAPAVSVAASPLTAQIDLAGNQIAGTGPASTTLTVAAGRIDGYVTKSSSFTYVDKRVTTDGSGNYGSGTFQCGTSGYLAMHPGSFGYVGFEDARGSFVYRAFAVPSYQVMVDYPQVEGWIADGATGPTITIRDAAGNVKHQGTVEPQLAYLTSQKLYSNVFFQTKTAQFILPGDTVTVAHGGRTSTIPAFGVTAYIDSDGDLVSGEGPAGQSLRVIPASDRTSYRDLTPGADGKFRAAQPFTSVSSTNCAESPKTLAFDPGASGRVYAKLADGNELFAAYGRSIHVNLNENYFELYQFPTRGLDWESITARDVAITVTPRQGSVFNTTVRGQTGGSKTSVTLTTPQGERVILRAGDSIRATFDEGPTGTTRPVTVEFVLPLVTGSPDIVTHTLAGVGPKGASGRATLTGQTGAVAPPLVSGTYTAYAPVQFSKSGATVPLVQGYAGTVSFTDASARRVWAAWAATAEATANPVKITGIPRAGETMVCGTAPPGVKVEIDDATVATQPVVIGDGNADGNGRFCVTVPPLQQGQVLLAKANGVYSQPFVVGGAFRTMIAYTTH